MNGYHKTLQSWLIYKNIRNIHNTISKTIYQIKSAENSAPNIIIYQTNCRMTHK